MPRQSFCPPGVRSLQMNNVDLDFELKRHVIHVSNNRIAHCLDRDLVLPSRTSRCRHFHLIHVCEAPTAQVQVTLCFNYVRRVKRECWPWGCTGSNLCVTSNRWMLFLVGKSNSLTCIHNEWTNEILRKLVTNTELVIRARAVMFTNRWRMELATTT